MDCGSPLPLFNDASKHVILGRETSATERDEILNDPRMSTTEMTLKQKLVMIASLAIVLTIIILNFIIKFSTTWFIMQVLVLLTVQIYGMKILKNKKPDSN